MLNFPNDTTNDAKCHVTHGIFGHVDPKQPPVKRKPFSTILQHDFIHKIDLILPAEIYEIMKKDILVAINTATYSRVILPLKALLEGDFFNEYIKRGIISNLSGIHHCLLHTGNILMLSEGQLGIDKVYSLRQGVLTLYLDKESYERAGLVGQPEGTKGKRGTKPRWVVKIDLRSPSMFHGKKGFERIVYIFKNVLTEPVTWLFHDVETRALDPEPVDSYYPIKRNLEAQVSQDMQVLIPSLLPPTENDASYTANFDDYAVELHEWLSLILLDSPRVLADDKIDNYLSRYVPPGDPSTRCKLARMSWSGFMSAFWVRDVFVQILQAVPRESWFAFCVHELGEGELGKHKDCSILKLPATQPIEYMLWEIAP